MTAIISFLSVILAFVVHDLAIYFWKNMKKDDKIEPGEPGSGTMKEHYFTEVAPKKSVFRSKEIIDEENNRIGNA